MGDRYSADGHEYFDTPGLADPEMRAKAAQAIEEALKQDGAYKIIFVLFLQAGRLQTADIATMNCVLTACPSIGSQYAIIFNKVEEEEVEGVKENMKEILAKLYSDDSLPPTANVQVCAKNKELV